MIAVVGLKGLLCFTDLWGHLPWAAIIAFLLEVDFSHSDGNCICVLSSVCKWGKKNTFFSYFQQNDLIISIEMPLYHFLAGLFCHCRMISEVSCKWFKFPKRRMLVLLHLHCTICQMWVRVYERRGVGNFQGWKICETVCPFDLLTAFSLREPSRKLFISSSWEFGKNKLRYSRCWSCIASPFFMQKNADFLCTYF